MDNSLQFDIQIPDKLPKTFYNNYIASTNKVRALDTHKLLNDYQIDTMATIFNTIEHIVEGYGKIISIPSKEIPIHLIHQEPMNAYSHNDIFKIGHMLALQDKIAYTGLEVTHPVPFSQKYTPREDFIKKLQEKNITFQELETAINKKLLHLNQENSETIPTIQKYLSEIISTGVLPIHFSEYKVNHEPSISQNTLELQGLHLHLYSNHIVKDTFERKISYKEAKQILVDENTAISWSTKQEKMLEKVRGQLPNADLKFLQVPTDEWGTVLAYYIK